MKNLKKIKEVVQKLKECQENTDTEVAHIQDDDILAKFVHDIGYTSVAEEYEKVHKWYA